MVFNSIKKYLLVFSAILLIGGNIGFSSNNNEFSVDKTYIRRSKSVNPRLYRKAHYIDDMYSEDSSDNNINTSPKNYSNFRTFSEEDKNGKVKTRPHPYLVYDGPIKHGLSYYDNFEEEYEDYEDSVG